MNTSDLAYKLAISEANINALSNSITTLKREMKELQSQLAKKQREKDKN